MQVDIFLHSEDVNAVSSLSYSLLFLFQLSSNRSSIYFFYFSILLKMLLTKMFTFLSKCTVFYIYFFNTCQCILYVSFGLQLFCFFAFFCNFSIFLSDFNIDFLIFLLLGLNCLSVCTSHKICLSMFAYVLYIVFRYSVSYLRSLILFSPWGIVI